MTIKELKKALCLDFYKFCGEDVDENKCPGGVGVPDSWLAELLLQNGVVIIGKSPTGTTATELTVVYHGTILYQGHLTKAELATPLKEILAKLVADKKLFVDYEDERNKKWKVVMRG